MSKQKLATNIYSYDITSLENSLNTKN